MIEFPQIRVDGFTQPTHSRPHEIPSLDDTKTPTIKAPAAQYYLLTHAHTDHLVGLTDLHNNCTIICSQETKALLLNYERVKDRIDYDRALEQASRCAEEAGHSHEWVISEMTKRGMVERKIYEGLRRTQGVSGTRMQLDCIVSDPFDLIMSFDADLSLFLS